MPRIVRTVADLRTVVFGWRRAGESAGLVPTMGALHKGHLALVAAARAECDRCIASIFVNPTQFAPGEDLESYPRREAQDNELLDGAGCDLLFAPDAAAMYPPGFSTKVSVGGLDAVLCGASRPGHFDGVATVVTKLLNQAGADAAFFGQKDWQQLAIIKRLASDLNIASHIVGVPTMRETDGLALSSRNAYLTGAERETAPLLAAVLADTARRLAGGAPAASALRAAVDRLTAAGFAPEYLEMRDEDDLSPLTAASPAARLFAAARLGKARLIDNMPVSTDV